MLSIPEIKDMNKALDIFQSKMMRMGIEMNIELSNKVFNVNFKSNDFLDSHRVTTNILCTFLSYCFKKTYTFDYYNQLSIQDNYVQLEFDSHDAIVVMYHKWKSEHNLSKQYLKNK